MREQLQETKTLGKHQQFLEFNFFLNSIDNDEAKAREWQVRVGWRASIIQRTKYLACIFSGPKMRESKDERPFFFRC